MTTCNLNKTKVATKTGKTKTKERQRDPSDEKSYPLSGQKNEERFLALENPLEQ